MEHATRRSTLQLYTHGARGSERGGGSDARRRQRGPRGPERVLAAGSTHTRTHGRSRACAAAACERGRQAIHHAHGRNVTRLGRHQGGCRPAWTRRAVRLASAASAWQAGIVGAARRLQRRVRANLKACLGAEARESQLATFHARRSDAPRSFRCAIRERGALPASLCDAEAVARWLQHHCKPTRLRQPLRQSIVARLLRGGRRRTRAPIAALCTAAACYGTDLAARCRGAIGTQARAMAERCCSAAIGVEPDAADGVKCEGTEREWRFSRLSNQGVLHVASGVGGSE